MSAVLTVKSNVVCGHYGTAGGAVKVVGSSKLTVSSGGVLLEDGVVQPIGAMPPCQIVVNQTSTKCLNVLTVLPTSLAQKLTVGGKPVVLETLAGTTDGMVATVKPQLLLNATALQKKLTTV